MTFDQVVLPDVSQSDSGFDEIIPPGVTRVAAPAPTAREQLTLQYPEGSDQYQNMLSELYRQQNPNQVAPLPLAERVRQTILAPTPETPFDISGEHQVEIPRSPIQEPLDELAQQMGFQQAGLTDEEAGSIAGPLARFATSLRGGTPQEAEDLRTTGARTLQNVASPENAALIALTGGTGPIAEAAQLAFAGQGGEMGYDAVMRLIHATSPEEKNQAITDLFLAIPMVASPLHPLLREPSGPIRTTPLEMPQLEPSATLGPGTTSADVSAAIKRMSDLRPDRQFTLVPEPPPDIAPSVPIEQTLPNIQEPLPFNPETPPFRSGVDIPLKTETQRVDVPPPPIGTPLKGTPLVGPNGETPAADSAAAAAPQEGPVPTISPEAPVPPSVSIPAGDERYAGVTPSTPVVEPVSTKNAAVEAARETRNLEPIASQAAQEFGTAWDKSAQQLAQDPGIGRRLVEQFKAKVGAADDVINAHLLREQIKRQAEYDTAVKGVNESAPGSPENALAQERLAHASQDYFDVHQAVRNSGTGTGRGLNARKMLADDQYTLAKTEARMRAAVGGRPLTEGEMAQVAKLWNKLNRQRLNLEKTERAVTGTGLKLRANGSEGGFIDPTIFRDVVDFGKRIYGQGMDYARWAAEMVQHLGNKIREHLARIWDQVTDKTLPSSRERGAVGHTGLAGKGAPLRGSDLKEAKERARETAVRASEDIAKTNIQRVFDTPVSLRNNAIRLRNALPRERRSMSAPQQVRNAVAFYKHKIVEGAKAAIMEPWGEAASKQYQGYNIYAHDMAEEFNRPPETVMATESGLSPNTSPEQSHEAARRLMKMLRDNTDRKFDEHMENWARNRTGKNSKEETVHLYPSEAVDYLKGKSFNDIPKGDVRQAMWMRAFDEVYHPDRTLRVIRPDGSLGDFDRTPTGNPNSFAWTMFKMMQNGIDALQGNRPLNEILSTAKVANYYMSKLLAFEPSRHVVVDTHHTSHAFGNSLPSSHELVTKAFQSGRGGPEREFGGLYSIIHEATLQAADELGMDPKELQALVWSYQRGYKAPDSFGRSTEGLAAVEAIQKLWTDAAQGKITERQAHAGTEKIAREFHGRPPAPSYFGKRSSGEGNAGTGNVNQPAELPTDGRLRGRTGPRIGIDDTAATTGVEGAVAAPATEVGEAGVSGRSFRVTSPERRRAFYEGVKRTNAEHPNGASVEVKDPSFYADPNTSLFLSDDGLTGVAVTKDGNLVSVFKHPEAQSRIGPILAEAAQHATHLEAFTTDGKLPNLYAKDGFRPVARVPFDPKEAPENWNPADGHPDIVFMVRDPEDKLGLPNVAEKGYSAVKDQVPLVKDWSIAERIQHKAVDLWKSLTGQDVLPGARERGSVPLPSPDRYTKAYQTRLSNQTEALKQKLAAQDATKIERQKRVLDRKTFEMRAEYQRVKNDVDRMILKAELKNRPFWQRALDTTAKMERAMKLAGVTIYPKLAAAAAARIGTRPLEQMTQSVLGQIPGLRRIHEAAPLSGFSPDAERAALAGIIKGAKEFPSRIMGKQAPESELYGKPQIEPKSWLDIPGSTHGALKAPVEEAERARATTMLTDQAKRQGLDLTDPRVRQDIGEAAHQEAKRSIFMQDNVVSTAWQSMLRSMETSKKFPIAGKIGATLGRILLPIVRIPTNIGIEAGIHTPILGQIAPTAKLLQVMHRGIETIKPEEANMIMRHYAKGAIGAGLFFTGYFMAANGQIGGFYQPGKRKPGAVSPMAVKIGGVEVPGLLMHAPAFLVMQAGATFYNASHHVDAHGKPDQSATLRTARGLAQEIPFVKETGLIDGLLADEYQGRKARGQFISGNIVPQFVRNVASWTDQLKEPQYRSPETTLDFIKRDIPGLREQVRVKSGLAKAIKGQRNTGAFAVP